MKLIYTLLIPMLALELAVALPNKKSTLPSGMPQAPVESVTRMYSSVPDLEFVTSRAAQIADIVNGNTFGQAAASRLHIALNQGSLAKNLGPLFETVDNIEMTEGTLLFETKLIGDLPTNIQAFIRQRTVPNSGYISKLTNLDSKAKEQLASKNELSFTSCSVYAMPDNSKRYEVFVKYFGMTDLPLIFDENAKLIWVGNFNRLESIRNFDDLSGGTSKISKEELDIFSNEINTITEFKDFEITDPTSNSQASLNTYAGVKSYELIISKEGPNGIESRILRYDGNRKIISTYYSVQ